MKKPLIIGAGSPLVDLLIEEGDHFVEKLGSEKGGMTMVEAHHIDGAVGETTYMVKLVPGGSACNTLVGIGKLGARARMLGRLGRDELAQRFREGLEAAGVEHRIAESDSPTGRVLSVVTPDAQRTMFTCLGAAAEFHPDDVDHDHFEDAHIVHLEGYQLYNPAIVEKVVFACKNSGAKLSLDLASFQVVEHCRDTLIRLVEDHVDILLANEDEARAYTGKDEQRSLEIFASHCEIAVVKLGERGALLARGEERTSVDAHRVAAVDTTGAGDLWASGFLYGVSHGHGLEPSGKLGAAVAAEVVQVLGAVIPDEGWQRIQAFRETLGL